MSLENLVFIMANILGTYSIYKLMKFFYGESLQNKYIEIFMYIIYSILNCMISIKFPIPAVIMIYNILSFYLLSLLEYKCSIGKRIWTSIYVYTILFCIEVFISQIIDYKKILVFENNSLGSVYLNIVIQMVTFIIVIILYQFKITKNENIEIPFRYWIGIISVPIGTLFFMILFISSAHDVSKIQFSIMLFFVIIFNIINFQLYSSVVNLIQENNIKSIMQQQKECYLKQLKIENENSEKIIKIKHDMKNHLLTLQSLYNKRFFIDYEEYFNALMGKIEKNEFIINSGNIIIDSILNFKLNKIKNNVKLDIEANVPKDLNISEMDLTILFGNLVDNAIEAVNEVINDKKITINLNYNKGRLIIFISNTYKKINKISDGEYITKKKGNHGIGLKNIRDVIEKYDGMMEIQTENNHFNVMAILFC